MGFNEVLSSWSSSEEEDGHDHDEDRDQVLKKYHINIISALSYIFYLHLKNFLRRIETKSKKK